MRLVVTADDLGLSPGITAGVIEAHRRGVVRSASLIVTMPSAEEGADAARAEPDLEVGLHLDLVDGEPASEPAAVRSLIDHDGRFLGLGRFARALATGRIRPSEIGTELRAQARRARGWGIEATAWDSHRHTHALPLVARVVGAVAREEGVRWLRRPMPGSGWRGPKTWALAAATSAAAPFFRGVGGNDWYIDLTSWGGDAATVALLATRSGVGELGAHPGTSDDEGLPRRRELAILTDPLLRAAFGDDTVCRRVDG